MFHIRVGEQTYLRLVEQQHAQELLELIQSSHEHLRPWMNWADQRRNMADVAAYIDTGLKRFSFNQGIHAGIWENRRLCGMISCFPIDWANKAALLEYWLGASFQGLGIMSASGRAFVDYAFGPLKLHRLTIRCATGNHRSRAVAGRLGFTLEGVCRDAEWLGDHFVDHVIYGRLSS